MELLIEQVKSNPCLWDKNCYLYKNVVHKQSIWEAIAKICGIDNIDEAKSIWKKLRDSHREALRRRRSVNEKSAQIIGPWKYEQNMDFLLPQMNKDRDMTLIEHLDIEDDSVQLNNDIEDIVDNNKSTIDIAEQFQSFQMPLVRSKTNNNTAVSFTKREHRRELKLKEREELRRQSIDRNRIANDALYDLFSSMYQKTRLLPKYLQLRVQKEMFNSVTQAEEEAMANESNNPCSNYSDSSYNLYSVHNRPTNTSSPGPPVKAELEDELSFINEGTYT